MSVKKKIITEKDKVTRKVREADVSPVTIVKVGESQMKNFVEFLRTQGAVGLAIGLVLGGAVSVMVKSLVDNVVMPPLGMLMGSAEGIKGLTWTIGNTASGTPTVLKYGIFLNDFINFLVIAVVVYVFVSLFKIEKIDKKKK